MVENTDYPNEEINEYMGKMIAGDEPGLVVYYPFEGNANDMTSNGNHGQVAFGEPKYVDVTAELALEPVPVASVSPKDKLTSTWAKIKQTR